MSDPLSPDTPDFTPDLDITEIDTVAPATGFLEAAEARLLDMAEDAKIGLVRSMDRLVMAAHRLAADIESMAGPQVGDLARSAAEFVTGVQTSLTEKPISELLEDGQDLIRRQPVIAIGVAVASGYLLARLARNSAEKK